MKCERCGFIPNPGDQICMICGAKLSVKNAVMPGLEKVSIEKNSKSKNTKLIILLVGGIILLAVIVFVIIKFLILKR